MRARTTCLAGACLLVLVVTGSLTAAQRVGDIESLSRRDINQGGFDSNISLEEEMELGRELSTQLESRVELLDDPALNDYVDRVGQKLVEASDAQAPFTFRVVRDTDVNGLALPGGFVYVNAGVILTADSEAEVASVLAHLIARVAARHALENETVIRVARGSTIPRVFLASRPEQSFASLGTPDSLFPFSRRQVEEADFLGVRYLYEAGYAPDAAVAFLEKLQAQNSVGPEAPSPLFASHPPIAARIERIRRAIADLFSARSDLLQTTPEFEDVKRRLPIGF